MWMVDPGCAKDVSYSESNLWPKPAKNVMCHEGTAARLKVGIQAEWEAGLQRIMMEFQVSVDIQVHRYQNRSVRTLTANNALRYRVLATRSESNRTGRCGLILCPYGALPKRIQGVFWSGRMTR